MSGNGITQLIYAGKKEKPISLMRRRNITVNLRWGKRLILSAYKGKQKKYFQHMMWGGGDNNYFIIIVR